MLRRIVCGIPTQGTNKLMAELVRLTSDERCLENLQARLFALQGARRLPDDAEFRRALQERDLYNVRFRSYLLRRLENHGRKERVVFENYTIEHIMPQTENLNRAWRRDLGGNYKEIHGKYLHTLGNLTLTGYNSEYSDRSFAEKRDMRGGFRESPLSLNKGLGSLNAWNEASIIERARRLSDIAVNVWPIPAIADATFAAQRLIQSRRTEYTYDDHRYLKNSAMHDLFMEFRKAVLAFDPSVTEEILKQYVAFKYDTNFVDVVPQAKRLRLELNMPFHEIRDSRGMCEDVSGKGHWGNGDVEVSLTSLDDLPYVLGLVRQSFERQLGSDV
jgi:predicted transport protein